jgi:hypothetical protein
MALIAACNPQAIAALLADRDRLAAEVEIEKQHAKILADCHSDTLRRMEVFRKDAERFRWLRSRDIDTIHSGGIFAGMTPDNVVLNGDDLDAAIDAALGGSDVGGGDTEAVIDAFYRSGGKCE